MRIEDIVKDFADLIDQERQPKQVTAIVVAHPTATVEKPQDANPFTKAGDDLRRFRQIVDLADNNGVDPYGNSPKEKYADIDSVTCDAGGGWQAPKHPSDIRADHVSMYPGWQHRMGE